MTVSKNNFSFCLFNAFNFYYSSFILSFYFIFLYVKYFEILNVWRGQTLFKVGNKDTDTVSLSLMGTLNTTCLIYSSDDLL